MITTVWDAARQTALESTLEHLSKQDRIRRGKTQMTLGKMIDRLRSMPLDSPTTFLTNPHSYRGYDGDLALEMPNEEMPAITVSYALYALIELCLNKSFEGYKGGTYVMTRDTPLWIANYGECGQKIIGVDDDGYLELAYDD